MIAGSAKEAKRHMQREANDRQLSKRGFLREERSAMITGEETEHILQKSFLYIASLMEFNSQLLEFSLNHHLYEGFKQKLLKDFGAKLILDTDWSNLVEASPAA